MKSTGDTISSFAYTYDDVGNRLSKTYANGDTEFYTYDDLYQLTKVESKNRIAEYEYDKVGNRLRMIENDDTTSYSYNYDNQLLSYNTNGSDTMSFTYDANGNQITKSNSSDTLTYFYSDENNLVGISAVNDTNIISYIYSPDGKRLRKIVNGVGAKYFYEDDNVIAEYDTNTNVQARYTNNLRIDDIILTKRNNTIEYYFEDALGSAINLVNSEEDTTVTYLYNEFGMIKYQSVAHDNEMTYTGRRYDKQLKLYYYRSRYYNDEIGRFIKKDSFLGDKVNPISLHRYLYVQNNPINYYDPLGQSATPPTPCDGRYIGDRHRYNYTPCWRNKTTGARCITGYIRYSCPDRSVPQYANNYNWEECTEWAEKECRHRWYGYRWVRLAPHVGYCTSASSGSCGAEPTGTECN